MIIKSFVFNRNQVNTYVVWDEETKEGMIVDCGCSSDKEFNILKDYIGQEQINPMCSVCTHLHFDHVWGVPFLQQEYGLATLASRADEELLEWNMMCTMFMGLKGEERRLLQMREYSWIDNIDEIQIGHYGFTIISTPGHSPGSISLYCKDKFVLFSGDIIFNQGVGRTDFEGGNRDDLYKTIDHVLRLPEETKVFPGHNQGFTIKERKMYEQH